MGQASLKSDCGADVLLIGARGTQERNDDATVGFGDTVLSTYHAMSRALAPRNVVAEAAEYHTLTLGAAISTGGADYPATVAAGFESVRAKLGAWADKCPNYRFVLVGYSLGANIIGDAVADLAQSDTPRDKAILARIDGVALFGDPRLNPADPAVVDPPPDGGQGMFRFWAPFVTESVRPAFRNLDGVVRSWCSPRDYVCDSISATDVARIPGAMADQSFAHFHYRDAATAAAGQWLAERARAAIDGTTRPPTQPPATTAPAPQRPPAVAAAAPVAPSPTGQASVPSTDSAPVIIEAPPSSAVAPAPKPDPAANGTRFAVYHTCANGACGLARHTGPGFRAYPRTGTPLVDGDPVDVTCQSAGEAVSGKDGSSSTVWDRLTDGSWVADFYVSTPGTSGAFSPSLLRC